MSGRSSIIIPTEAITSATDEEFSIPEETQAAKQEIKIAAKHVRLPSAVFPPVSGMCAFPNSFPERLARPSPKASAYIPIEDASGCHKIEEAIIPETRVTGPRTNLF